MPIKEATFWFGITVFGTGLFGVMEGGDRMLTGIALAIIGLLVTAYAVVAHHYANLPKLPIWLGMLIITWAAIGYDIYDRHTHAPNRWQSRELTPIVNQTFANETVHVDGHSFMDVRFDNVSLDYEGTSPIHFERISFGGSRAGETMTAVRLSTHNPVVHSTVAIMNMLNEASGCKLRTGESVIP